MPPEEPPPCPGGSGRKISQRFLAAQASQLSHLIVTVLAGPFPSLLFLVSLLLLLLRKDVVNPGQVVLGEDEV